jgi:hypothetical protein
MTADEIEELLPNLAAWVQSRGWIEIGDRDWQGFVARLLDAGGLCLEAGPRDSLGAALLALEQKVREVDE